MSLQDEETYRHWRISLRKDVGTASCKELFKSDEIAERLAHLLAIDCNHIVVHPVADGIMSRMSHRLRYLAFMMREHQIHATTVNVERVAKIFLPHC